MSDVDLIKYFINGGVGGIMTVITGHPLDTLKVRLQTQPIPKAGEKPMYEGMMDCARKIIAKEGPLGLYKGITPPLCAIAPIFAMSFFSFGLGQKIYSKFVPDKPKTNEYGKYFCGGAFSAVAITTITAPGERIKCLLQIQESKQEALYSGPVDAAKKIYQEGGLRAIYKGTAATLLREIPGSGTYFLTYEVMKNYLTDFGNVPCSFLGTVFCGGMAGVTYWLVSMPADVIKSRIQTAPEGTYPNGVRQVFRELVAQEGPKALYRGMLPVMVRAFPANAACFVGFEISDQCLKFLFPRW